MLMMCGGRVLAQQQQHLPQVLATCIGPNGIGHPDEVRASPPSRPSSMCIVLQRGAAVALLNGHKQAPMR